MELVPSLPAKGSFKGRSSSSSISELVFVSVVA